MSIAEKLAGLGVLPVVPDVSSYRTITEVFGSEVHNNRPLAEQYGLDVDVSSLQDFAHSVHPQYPDIVCYQLHRAPYGFQVQIPSELQGVVYPSRVIQIHTETSDTSSSIPPGCTVKSIFDLNAEENYVIQKLLLIFPQTQGDLRMMGIKRMIYQGRQSTVPILVRNDGKGPLVIDQEQQQMFRTIKDGHELRIQGKAQSVNKLGDAGVTALDWFDNLYGSNKAKLQVRLQNCSFGIEADYYPRSDISLSDIVANEALQAQPFIPYITEFEHVAD